MDRRSFLHGLSLLLAGGALHVAASETASAATLATRVARLRRRRLRRMRRRVRKAVRGRKR